MCLLHTDADQKKKNETKINKQIKWIIMIAVCECVYISEHYFDTCPSDDTHYYNMDESWMDG